MKNLVKGAKYEFKGFGHRKGIIYTGKFQFAGQYIYTFTDVIGDENVELKSLNLIGDRIN